MNSHLPRFNFKLLYLHQSLKRSDLLEAAMLHERCSLWSKFLYRQHISIFLMYEECEIYGQHIK